MLSHVTIGAADFDRARRFYQPLMAALGFPVRLLDLSVPWKVWSDRTGGRPFVILMCPFDGQPHVPGNGQMVALSARSRHMVDDAYALAIANGAVCEGPPGLRPYYHAHFYGAYFRDPEGNKICVVCHDE